jgi:hypothetical protein
METYLTSIIIREKRCNNVGHLFWFTILAQHDINDVILYIHSVHKHRGNTFQCQNYKMRLKQKFELNKFGMSLSWKPKFYTHFRNEIDNSSKLDKQLKHTQTKMQKAAVWHLGTSCFGTGKTTIPKINLSLVIEITHDTVKIRPCAFIFCVYQNMHGGVSHIRARSLWPWSLTKRSDNLFFMPDGSNNDIDWPIT